MATVNFYNKDKVVVSFDLEKQEFEKDGFVLFPQQVMPALVKDGRRYYKYDRIEFVKSKESANGNNED